MEIPTLKLLISIIGSIVGPNERPSTSDNRLATAAWFYTSAMHASDFVHRMIDRLGSIPTNEATDALTTLQTDDNLSKWQYSLKNRLANQRSIRRNQEYQHPTVDEICQTLNGGTPANAGDLAALVIDRLSELTTTIRDGNTDDWKQYWNEDSYGKPLEPKSEDSCRDMLLSDLRQRLPDDVDAQPEGQYANDKRADMRIPFSNFQVPVEVKKNSHRELWSAMHTQLISSTFGIRRPTDTVSIWSSGSARSTLRRLRPENVRTPLRSCTSGWSLLSRRKKHGRSRFALSTSVRRNHYEHDPLPSG